MTTRLESIDEKLSSVVTVDVHSSALSALRIDLLREFEATVSRLEAKFAELEAANKELRIRVDRLESQFKSVAAPDEAHRRISFIGFKSGSDLERISSVRKFMNEHFPDISVQIGNIMKGPRSSRVLTSVVYCTFSDSDVRNAVLAQVRSRSLKFPGEGVAIKPALSAVIRARIWALNKAHELISASSLCGSESVTKVNTPELRCIRVGSTVAFEQKGGSSDLGSFLGSFAGIQLPVGRSAA